MTLIKFVSFNSLIRVKTSMIDTFKYTLLLFMLLIWKVSAFGQVTEPANNIEQDEKKKSDIDIIVCYSPSYKHYFKLSESDTTARPYLDKFIGEIAQQFENGRNVMVIHVYSAGSTQAKDTSNKSNLSVLKVQSKSIISYMKKDERLAKFVENILFVNKIYIDDKILDLNDENFNFPLYNLYVSIVIE